MAEDYEDKENAIIRQKLAYPGTGGSNLHQKLISRLTARRRLSERSMNRRYDGWNQVDEHCRMFIDLSRSVKKGDGTTESGKSEIPWARSIVVPLTYAILQVQMTQLMGIFTRRDPPLEIQGVGPEDVKPAKLMNAVIAYDQVQTNFILELYTAILDAKKYGMGGFHDCWGEEFGYKTERASGMTERILKMLGMPTSQTRWAKLRQYNKVEAFDPFSTYPDARLSLSKLQNGEFFFTTLWRGYLEILANSIENGGNYFNVEAVPRTTPRNRTLRSRNRFQTQQMNLIGSMDERDKGFHAIDSGVVSIIPSEWELGDGDRPEKWQFTWVDDTVIIRAHPADYDHEQFNFSVIESNIDTHVFGNPGSSENLDGLQRFMNWKYNCADSLTEILTPNGFKFLKDLSADDEVATIDPETHDFWFEKPKEHFEYDFDGEMVRVKTDQQDMLVTPNHQMYVGTVTEGKPRFRFKDAAAINHRCKFLGSVKKGAGIEEGELILEAETRMYANGGTHSVPIVSIPYSDLATFLGYFVSEGNCYVRPHPHAAYRITIGQSKKNADVFAKIENSMESLPFNVCRFDNRDDDVVTWTITNRRFAEWVQDNCGDGCRSKKIPDCVYTWGPTLQRKFLDAAIDGDGHRKTDNYAQYYSSSKELADGIQAIAVSLGYKTVLGSSDSKGTEIFCVSINGRTPTFALQPWSFSREVYKGKVYCIENSTHLTIYRRNGKVGIHGQSHTQNIMRHLNNRMIYDPALVEQFDVDNPDAAMHIRMTALGSEALREGRLTIEGMIHQLQLVDVTGGMLKELAFDLDLAMRMSGAADQMMGRTTQERRTLGEITRVGHEGSARMAMDAMMIDVQGLRPLALRWCSNRQQYTEDEMFLRIAGKTAEEFSNDVQNGRILIKPGDLYGNFDYAAKVGPEPGTPEERAQVLMDGLTAIMKQPEILALPDKNGKLLDPHEFIKEMLRDRRVSNVDDFYRAIGGQPGQTAPAPGVTVMPDDQVQKMAQQGNIVPIRGAA